VKALRNALHLQLPRLWQARGPLTCLLWPLSGLYRLLWSLQAVPYALGLRQAARVPALVVVVGNVVAGGAGKTPLTLALVRHLQQRGLTVGVVSRGYGRHAEQTQEVLPDSDAKEVGDEPLLIRRLGGAPVWVARQRAAAARALLQAHPQVRVIVCDDGLQHRALARDIEICILDERGTGNGWLLPAGPLREPWPRKVDLLLGCDAPTGMAPFRARRLLADSAHDAQGQQFSLSSLAAQPVDALAGIARPERFFGMLRERGLQLQDTLALADHADFSQWRQRHTGRPLLCTEKDAVKLWPRQPDALAVGMTLEPEAAFFQAFDALLERHAQRLRPVSSAHGQETA
jgi:tetraacyldisaccharide 4'-kinase